VDLIPIMKREKTLGTWWRNFPPGKIQKSASGDVVCCDALDFLDSLADGCADIVFLDPPFNLGKTYGTDRKMNDQLNDSQYWEYISRILFRSCKVLRQGGALYLYHIPRWAIRCADLLLDHLQFRHWISVSMKNGFARGNRLYPAHYALLYFTKGNPSHFQRPKVPVAKCRHCGGVIKDYGGYKRFMQSGVNLTDVWDDISPVRHKKYKHRCANELSQGITDRAIAISGVRGGLLVDPFVGTGTSLVSAVKQGMRFVACDLDNTSIAIAVKRILTTKREMKGY
jgi:site-specific DNA-methyltransferase (adenine-specific)